MRRRELRDVHGTQNRGPSDAEATEEARGEKRVPAPGERAAERRNEIQNGHPSQHFARTVALAQRACAYRPDDGAPERDGYGEPQLRGSESIDMGKRCCGAGDHRGVEAEEQAAERSDERASQDVPIYRHGRLLIEVPANAAYGVSDTRSALKAEMAT